MQEVYWILLSAPTPAEGVIEAGWGRGRNWTVIQPQRSQPIPRGALQGRWPYRVVPNWGKRPGLFTPRKPVFLCRLLPGGMGPWARSFSSAEGNSPGKKGTAAAVSTQQSPLPAEGEWMLQACRGSVHLTISITLGQGSREAQAKGPAAPRKVESVQIWAPRLPSSLPASPAAP